jgi:GAF domain-containing protein
MPGCSVWNHRIVDEDWSVLERLARAVHVKDANLPATLDAILKNAVDTVEVADDAGLVIVDGRRLVPCAVTGEPPQLLDALQNEIGSGPCIDAGDEQEVMYVEDMAAETRWPQFSPQAVELGVAAMLCLPLWIAERSLGTLSLYCSRPHEFTDRDVRVASLFATHAALALADAQRTDQLQGALRNRDLIGQAKGILIERHRVTPDEAFRILSRASQDANVKLTGVAQHLVDTGALLGRVD